MLEDIRRAAPELRPGTTVILDGVCPYLGPAIVFESPWDLAGALQVAYRDPTLRGDVTTGTFSIDDESLTMRIYKMSVAHPYGPDLLLFNHQQRTIVQLTDVRTARAQLLKPTACPSGAAGQGTVAFPFDNLFRGAEARRFRPWR